MSHGYIDDIPGHAEFWKRFKYADSHKTFLKRLVLRYRLLKRLLDWNIQIWKLRRLYPKKSLEELENMLIEIEVIAVMKVFEQIEELKK